LRTHQQFRAGFICGLAGVIVAGIVAVGASVTPSAGASASDGRTTGTHPQRGVRAASRVIGCVAAGPATRTGPATRQRVVALSFDDGPWAATPAVLGILERFHVHATFFEIGRQITLRTRPWLLRILRDGDSIGDHTWSHPSLLYQPPSAIRSQILGTAQQIHHMTGFRPCLMRPPYGAYNPAIVRIAASLGLRTVLWSVDPADWARPGTPSIISRVRAGIAPGRIILLHDGGGDRTETIAALPAILTQLAHRHYRVVTVEMLLNARMLTSR
jgi:peptidoglycan-N-acetylglucosamine deacetylase